MQTNISAEAAILRERFILLYSTESGRVCQSLPSTKEASNAIWLSILEKEYNLDQRIIVDVGRQFAERFPVSSEGSNLGIDPTVFSDEALVDFDTRFRALQALQNIPNAISEEARSGDFEEDLVSASGMALSARVMVAIAEQFIREDIPSALRLHGDSLVALSLREWQSRFMQGAEQYSSSMRAIFKVYFELQLKQLRLQFERYLREDPSRIWECHLEGGETETAVFPPLARFMDDALHLSIDEEGLAKRIRWLLAVGGFFRGNPQIEMPTWAMQYELVCRQSNLHADSLLDRIVGPRFILKGFASNPPAIPLYFTRELSRMHPMLLLSDKSPFDETTKTKQAIQDERAMIIRERFENTSPDSLKAPMGFMMNYLSTQLAWLKAQREDVYDDLEARLILQVADFPNERPFDRGFLGAILKRNGAIRFAETFWARVLGALSEWAIDPQEYASVFVHLGYREEWTKQYLEYSRQQLLLRRDAGESLTRSEQKHIARRPYLKISELQKWLQENGPHIKRMGAPWVFLCPSGIGNV